MSSLKQISLYTILALFILSAITPMAIALAQISAVRIVSVSEPAYPGEPVVITLDVGLATTVTVRLCNNPGCDQVWVEQSFVPPTAGRYTVSLMLPEKLNGLRNLNATYRQGWVVASTVFNVDTRMFAIAPKIKVNPVATTVVSPDLFPPYFRPNSVTVELLGYAPNETVTTIVFSGPATYNVPVSVRIGNNGYNSTTVNLLTITGVGIPRGVYKVYGVGGITTDLRRAKNGTLEIRPQAIISPREGFGRCDRSVCELHNVAITGYGFSANVAIVKIELWNINFTNVKYVFTPPTGFRTDANGYFTLSNLTRYIADGRGTNMTAGLYIPIVHEAPLPATLQNASRVDLGRVGTVVVSEAAVLAALGTRASVRATSYVNGTLDYVPKYSVMAYTLTEVLRINITYAGKRYQLAANIDDLAARTVRFALYNTTAIPYVTLINTTAVSTYDANLGAHVANIWFNIARDDYTTQQPQQPGIYRYWATFYIYPNQILLQLREWSFVVTKANLTIVYTNRDTGVTISRFYIHPTNLTVVDTSVRIPTALRFTDAGIEWTIDWRYDPATQTATVVVTGRPVVGPSFEFRNVYYIVRPLLVLLGVVTDNGTIVQRTVMPGDRVAIAAYGYAPGAFWRHIPPRYDDNYLDVYWEKIVKLGTFKLGKDGNLTFIVTIPSDATFGVHYIWGVDKWGYEYTLAIIIGARAYYTIVPVPPRAIPKEPIVSAGYDDKRLMVCPCPESYVGLSYCAKCVVYAGICDYLGDEIKVVISGASPGERFTIYFAGRAVKTVIANASIVEVTFIVPTVPEGNYQIIAVGTVSGTIDVTASGYFNGTHIVPNKLVMVTPKILLVDLGRDISPILVGPGFVRVIGTGFRPGVSFIGMLVNSTDAAFTLNMQVQRWTAGSNGVLMNSYSPEIVPGLYMPALEPGVYEVKLLYVVAAETKTSLPGYVFVINNLSIAATKLDIEALKSVILGRLDTIEKAVKDAQDAISRVERSVATLHTVLETRVAELRRLVESGTADLKKALDDLSKAVATKSDVQALAASISDVKTAVSGIAKAVEEVKTAIANVATKGDVKAVADAVGRLDTKLDTLAGDLDDAIRRLEGLSRAVDNVAKAIPTDAINEIRNSVLSALDALKQARDEVAALRSDVAGLRTDVSGLRADVGTVKSDVAAVKSDAAKIGGVDQKVKALDEGLAGLRTLVIIALVFAVIAAAAAIYATVAISRAVAK